MSSHDKALEAKKKHTHKRGSDGKCSICNVSMKGSEGLDEKGKKPHKEFGAKNTDSEED